MATSFQSFEKYRKQRNCLSPLNWCTIHRWKQQQCDCHFRSSFFIYFYFLLTVYLSSGIKMNHNTIYARLFVIWFSWKQYGNWWQFDELCKNIAMTYASVSFFLFSVFFFGSRFDVMWQMPCVHKLNELKESSCSTLNRHGNSRMLMTCSKIHANTHTHVCAFRLQFMLRQFLWKL